VLDEAQRIKNWATKTSVFVKQLRPPWRLVLSGTPLENRLTELASLMDWIDDLALEPKWRLDAWHAVRSDGVREVTGARHLSTLRARLEGSSLRRIRREVLDQLPPRTDTRVPVPLTPEQETAHADLDRPIAKLIATSKRRPLTQPEFLQLMSLLTRQRIICNGLGQRDFEQVWPQLEGRKPNDAVLRGLFTPKLAELRELLTNLVLTQGRKVVVFSQWKRMLRLAEWATSDLLGQAGLRAAYFTGDEGQKRRTQNVVDLHDDPNTRVLFATDAGGVGLNLQRAASACIHLDLPWNPAVLEQRSGRIYRLGQTKPVEIYTLVSSSGLESRIEAIVGDKKALFDGLFDGTSDGVSFEKGGSFLSTVQRLVDPVIPPEGADSSDEGESTEPGDVVDTTPMAAEPSTPSPPATQAATASPLMLGVRVERLPDGRMVLEAQPEAAATLAAMFEGMAALLKQAAERPRSS
jgi:SNF2 family DNA or RNA helicase